MKRILPFIKWLLIIWGGTSLFGVVVVGVYIAYKAGPGNHPKTNSASTHDVRFVLNWCGLGEKRIDRVVNSYQSARSFTGDHLDAYAIRITHVSNEELTTITDGPDGPHERWYPGDQLPPILDEALKFVGYWLGNQNVSWFPREGELRSNTVYVYPWSIEFHGVQPTTVELIFIRPSDRMVFYFGAKT